MMKQSILTLLISTIFSVVGNTQTFTSSHLPIVVVNTGNLPFDENTIPDDPKINVTFGIIDNGAGNINQITDPFNHYNGNAGIETRGNSTQQFEKKTYSLELWDNAGQDTSASLLGMGKEEDWILHAMVIDKSLLRLPFSFDLARSSGHYASDWRYVELVVDNDYRGIYILCEKIKRDNDRVDIAKLDMDDLAGDSLTGGYILRIDWLDNPEGFASNYNSMAGTPMFYQYYYPKSANIQPAQETYIKSYMDDFEEAIFDPSFTNSSNIRYNEYADITSFVDFLLINELSKNSDGYKLSSYLHKDKASKGGKLKAGPIWDFDQTYGISEVCSGNDPTGWTYLQNQAGCEDHETMPMWWQAMMSDTLFTNHLACRWQELRTTRLHLDSVDLWIDNQVATLGAAIDRNFTKWDFLGEIIWAETPPLPQTYAEEITFIKDWIQTRITWMDTHLPGNCTHDVVSTETIETIQEIPIQVFPNPVENIVYVQAKKGTKVRLLDMRGKVILQKSFSSTLNELDVSRLTRGVYLAQFQLEGRVETRRIVLQ